MAHKEGDDHGGTFLCEAFPEKRVRVDGREREEGVVRLAKRIKLNMVVGMEIRNERNVMKETKRVVIGTRDEMS